MLSPRFRKPSIDGRARPATINGMAMEKGKPTGRIDTKLIEQAIELLKTEQTIDHPSRRRRSLP